MLKLYLTFLLAVTLQHGWTQSRTFSLGVFTGITSSYTYDQGISEDQRYQYRYDLKFAPIGINFEVDFENVGFLISPGISTIGQNFYVINTSGGQEGVRKINLQYLNIPLGFKFKIIDLSFFRVSGIGSVSVAYILKGNEKVSHNDSKLKFVDEIVPPVLPANYIRQYDGVLSPTVNDYSMLSKKDFNSVQFFVAAGLRSDWDVNESWRISLDLRANYGLFEPRKTDYLNKLKLYQTLYDLPGSRRDLFVHFTVGVSRFVVVDKKGTDKRNKVKGYSKKRSLKSHSMFRRN